MEDRKIKKKRSVAWFGIRVLARTSVQVMLSAVFERFADKREIEGAVPAGIVDGHRDDEEIWIDYVSDLGDGFAATTTIAHLLAQKGLPLGDGAARCVTPRASILVMGGDEVYPYATAKGYEERLVGPYRAMLPHTRFPHPMILAIPGNHDWYDGLTAFLRVFGQPRPRAHAATEFDTEESLASGTWIGGWRTVQRRSYFAAQLPHRWWLWGIDIQLDTYIDSAQLDYFMAAAEQLRAGDAVILCCAKPSWLEAGRLAPEVFAGLDFFERTIIRPTGAQLRLTLAGDHHAYVRYEERETGEQKIMAGGGGAYLAATHHFPDSLTLPPDESKASNKSPAQMFRRASTEGPVPKDTRYPSKGRSRIQALAFPRILVMNGLLFPLLVGLLYGLLSLAVRDCASSDWRWARFGAEVLPLFVVLWFLTHEKGHWYRRVVAIPHGAMHLGAVALLTDWLRSQDGWSVTVGVIVAGFVIGPLILGLYFFLADLLFRINTNELFASQRIGRYKCFVRMHIESDGNLTVRSVGVDRVRRLWRRPKPDEFLTRKHPPLQVPRKPVVFRVIDGPFTITREPSSHPR